jgi:transposase
VTETLDYVPGRFKVIRHIRAKLSCRARDTVVAAAAPDHAIARGRAGAGLLAHIVVSKYDDHLPLYRQAEIFARDGVSLETSTLSGWVGATAAALKPLVDALATDVLTGDTLHVDDTPVPVLAPGTGKTKTGRLWTYVAMNGHSLVRARRRPCSSIRPTARASIRRGTLRTSAASFTPMATLGSMSCSSAIGLSRPPAGRMCGANSLTSTPPPAHPSRKKRSIALASSTPSRRPSTDHRRGGDGSSANCSQSRLPRHWPLGPRARCASSPASPSSPRPSATCGRAGRR